MKIDDQDPTILTDEQRQLLNGMLGYIREIYASLDIINCYPELRVDWIDLNFPEMGVTMRVPIDLAPREPPKKRVINSRQKRISGVQASESAPVSVIVMTEFQQMSLLTEQGGGSS